MTVAAGVALVESRSDTEEVAALFVGLREEYVRRYGDHGPLAAHADRFLPPAGAFLVLREAGAAVGCGGFWRYAEGSAEIKRMFVVPAARGRGLSRLLLQELEARAGAAGYRETRLETGTEQPEALALYTAAGYEPMFLYGEFKDDPRSRCFRRLLG